MLSSGPINGWKTGGTVLDVRTLYFAVFLIALILGIAQTVACFNRRLDSWVSWWGAGNIVGGLGVFALTLHSIIPDYLSIAAANTLVLSSFLLFMTGIERFAGLKSHRIAYLGVVVLLFAALSIPSPLSQSLLARRLVSLVCDMAMNVRILLLLNGIVRKERLLAAHLVRVLFACSLALFAYRSFEVLEGFTGHDMFVSNLSNVGIALCWVIVVPGWNMGLMLMAAERMRDRLLHLAHQDPLTGVLNRGGMLAALEPMLNDKQGRYFPLTLLLVDLDYFKQINDRYGHAAGDVALKIFAEAARSHLRSTDILARQGGDEFAIVLPGLSKQLACQIAERLREEFTQAASRQFFGTQVTLTIGVACCTQLPCTIDSLFNAADKSLYSAKEGGRNRVLWLPGSGL